MRNTKLGTKLQIHGIPSSTSVARWEPPMTVMVSKNRYKQSYELTKTYENWRKLLGHNHNVPSLCKVMLLVSLAFAWLMCYFKGHLMSRKGEYAGLKPLTCGFYFPQKPTKTVPECSRKFSLVFVSSKNNFWVFSTISTVIGHPVLAYTNIQVSPWSCTPATTI